MSIEKIPIVRIRVSVLLRRDDGRICLVRHHKNGRRYWLLPGGGQDPYESLEDAARRELAEELNVTVKGFRFVALRESFSRAEKRHIQFPILEGLEPDFSGLRQGEDERVEGADFFHADEIITLPMYPKMAEEVVHLLRGEPVELFKTLEWVS